MQTNIKKILGLGSAKSGTKHFLQQRVSAIANLILGLALIGVLCNIIGKQYQQVIDTIANPLVSIILIAFIISFTTHMKIGMQVVIEDYLHGKWLKTSAMLANIFFCYGVMLSSIYFLGKIVLKV